MNILVLTGALGLAVASGAPILKTAEAPSVSPGDEVAVNFSFVNSSLSITRFTNNSSRYSTGSALVASEFLPDLLSNIDAQYDALNVNYEALTADYSNSDIVNAMLGNYAYDDTSLNDLAVSFSNSDLQSSQFTDGSTTANLFGGAYNVGVASNTSYVSEASNLTSRFGLSDTEKYVNTSDLTFIADYSLKTKAVAQDYFGLTYSSQFISGLFNNVKGLDYYRFSITFPDGYKVDDLSPIAIGAHDYQAYFTLVNPVTGYIEAVSSNLYSSLNRTYTPVPAYPGGTDVSYDTADIDGGAYKMYNNAYDGAYVYRIDIFTTELPTYILYNSMSAYYMAQFAGYASGFVVASNTGADYINGYNDGYVAGQAIGSDNALVGPFALIAGAFNAVASVLNLHVFGSITLGTFIFIPLIVLMIIVLVKLFRG